RSLPLAGPHSNPAPGTRSTAAPRRPPGRCYNSTSPVAPVSHSPSRVAMRARQAVIREPYQTAVREVELPDPAPNQVLVACEVSCVSAGTELAVYTGTHQWLKDPNLPDWKFPFRPGYTAAGVVVEAGAEVKGFRPGDRVSFPGTHASHDL